MAQVISLTGEKRTRARAARQAISLIAIGAGARGTRLPLPPAGARPDPQRQPRNCE
jgi:hypothetical protein